MDISRDRFNGCSARFRDEFRDMRALRFPCAASAVSEGHIPLPTL